MRGFFKREELDVIAAVSFNNDDDNIVGQISPESIQEACEEVGVHEDVEAVFVSCTNMRAIHKIPGYFLRTSLIFKEEVTYYLASEPNMKTFKIMEHNSPIFDEYQTQSA